MHHFGQQERLPEALQSRLRHERLHDGCAAFNAARVVTTAVCVAREYCAATTARPVSFNEQAASLPTPDFLKGQE